MTPCGGGAPTAASCTVPPIGLERRIDLARLFVLIGGLIVLALTVALVGPYFIDWTSYRSDFEREASRILGREVTVAGEATARLLPFPSVTFTDVQVAGRTEAEPSMTVETFSMDAELAPFMRGEFLIFDMRLHKPVMTIDVADDGLIDWTIRPKTPFDASQVKLEKISITEGAVAIQHAAGGRTYQLDAINADISARTLAGPWRVRGGLNFDGAPMKIAASTGTVDASGSMRLRLSVEPTDLALAVETDGNVNITDGGAVYSGTFRLEAAEPEPSPDDEDNAFAISIEAEEDPVVPFRVSGRFNVDHKLIDVSEFLFETGTEADPYTAEGSAFLDYGEDPSFSVQADGQQFRFDRPDSEIVGEQSFASRVASFRDMVQRLPRPAIKGTINVDLPAVVAGDTTIREVRLAAQPDANGWRIDTFSAELPGRATLEASGLLVSGGEFGFHGTLLLAVNQPSGFAAWLSKDVDNAIRRLPSAGFSARVNIDSQRQSFRDLELILGGARFTGEVDHLTPRESRPSMLLRLDGGALDVGGLAAFASIFIDDSGAARFSEHNLDFVVKAGPVSAAGLTAGSVDAALRLKDGLLDIDRLSIGDLAGATVSATGKLRNFPDSPTGSLDASIVAVDLRPLTELLARHYPQNDFVSGLALRSAAFPQLLTDTRIDMVASAASNNDGSIGLAISAHGLSGGSRFTASASGTSRQTALDGPLTLTVAMQNDDAAPLFAAYGLPALPVGLVGPAETNLTIAGEIGGLFDTRLEVRGDGSEALFEGKAGYVDGAWQANGKAKIASGDVEPWLATTGVALPGFGLGLPMDASARIDLSDGVLAVESIAGTISGDSIAGDVQTRWAGDRPSFAGTLSMPFLDLSPLGPMLLGEAALESQDGSPGTKPFRSSARFPLLAALDLTVDRLGVWPGEELQQASLSLNIDENAVRVSKLDADYRGGPISGLAEFRNSGGTALFSTQFKFADAALADLSGSDNLGGTTTLSANLTANGKSMAGLISSLSGSGTASLRDAVIPGVAAGVFDQFIVEADRIGKAIDADDVSGFAPDLVSSQSYDAGAAEFTFVLAGGVLRTPSILFDRQAADLEAELQLDLNIGLASADAEITYDPGREALVGAVPAVRIRSQGPLGSMVASYDTAPLAQFLTQRALELEQLRVEALQAGLLEKQRLRREVRYYASFGPFIDEDAAVRETPSELPAPETGTGEAVGAGASAGDSDEPGNEPLEDAVRRILDEEARKRVDEDARLQIEELRRRFAARGGVVSGPLPAISGTDNGSVADGDPDALPALPAFEGLSENPLTIDRLLQQVED